MDEIPKELKFGLQLYNFDTRLFNKAVEFFTKELGIDDSEVPIKLEIVDNIGKGTVGALCIPTYNDDYSKLTQLTLKVKRSYSVLCMIECLAHEMVHVKQFIKGEIKVEKVKEPLFFGLIKIERLAVYHVKDDVVTDMTDLSYYEKPTEQEAHIMQKHLTFEFLKLVEEKIEPDNMRLLLKL
jgi:hypothetical protein